MADLLKISVPSKPEYIRVVRLAVSSAASAAGFTIDDIEDIKIAVTEALSQLFEGRRGRGQVNYEITCELSDGKMTISIDEDPETTAEAAANGAARESQRGAEVCGQEGYLDKPQGPKETDMIPVNEWNYFNCGMQGLEAMTERILTSLFGPADSIFMLRALMDEVDVLTNRERNMLIRMMKYL